VRALPSKRGRGRDLAIGPIVNECESDGGGAETTEAKTRWYKKQKSEGIMRKSEKKMIFLDEKQK
jgi:hypothetical protein